MTNPTDSHAAAGGHHDVVVAPTKMPVWLQDMVEYVFKVKKRKTTIEMEIFTGVIQFISCLYVLPVVPYQMKRVGYDEQSSIIGTSATCALGCIVGAFLTDMPLIIAPPTSVSIFFAVFMQQANMGYREGNAALMISGALLALLGVFPPVGRFFTRLIPDSIQAAISVGIGLITALAGATEINLVVRGKYTILDMGEITSEVIVAISALVVVAVLLHYHVKGAFCIGLALGTFVWWLISEEWPKGLVAMPTTNNSVGDLSNDRITLLILNLFFLFILTLNGLARSLSDLANLTKPTGAIPRGNFLFIVCGLTTMFSGYISGPPILISPETAAGIKAGAKTGLSTLVCGLLFGVSAYFSPIFAAVPAAGTAPLLIMVGVMMFGNSKRIDWADYKVAVPAYCVLFFIPFTYSILRGVAFGYCIYIVIGLYTGDMITNVLQFIESYRNPCGPNPDKKKPLAQSEEDGPHGVGHYDDEDSGHGFDGFEDEIEREQGKTFFGRTILKIQKVLDAQEMQDGGITKVEQM